MESPITQQEHHLHVEPREVMCFYFEDSKRYDESLHDVNVSWDEYVVSRVGYATV